MYLLLLAEWLALVFSSQLDAQHSLELGQNLLVGYGFGLLVLVNDLLLLIDELKSIRDYCEHSELSKMPS